MPGTDFNLGSDVKLYINTTAGQLALDITTSFTAKPKYRNIESQGLDGETRHEDIPTGWDGSFELDRASGVVDQFFLTLENNRRAGIKTTKATIKQVIQERDGSISSFKFYDCSLAYEDAGTWKGNDKVTLRVGFKASGRK